MGKCPIMSSQIKQYLFILYNYDKIYIHAHPLKSNQELEIKIPWTSLYAVLKKKGVAPIIHILGTECATAMKKALIKNDVKFQLVPTYTHCPNTSERYICTFKNHICAGISSCNPNLPTQKWDRLIPQSKTTLNMLHYSQTILSLSEYATINEQFYFNATPLAPPVKKSWSIKN